MALTASERTGLLTLGVTIFNAALGASYLQDFTAFYESNGRSQRDLASALSGSAAFKALYPINQTAAQFANSVLTLYQIQDIPEAIDFVTAKFNARVDKGTIIYDVAVAISNYTGDYPALAKARAILNNKVTVAEYFSVFKGRATTDLFTLQRVIASVTDDARSIDVAKGYIDAGIVIGDTFTLTAGIDSLLGTVGNDTFVSDSLSLGATDSINGGGGSDTLNIASPTVSNLANLPKLTSVEKIYVNAAANGGTLDTSAIPDLVVFESEKQAANLSVKVSTGQSVVLTGLSAAAGATTLGGNIPTALGLTLNSFGSAVGTNTIDLNGSALATLSITATGSSKANVTNSGAALKTVTVGGTGAVELIANAAVGAAVTTVDASANTSTGAGVTWNATAGNVSFFFTFKGGAGNDTVSLPAGSLATLLTGTNLDGGAGAGDKLTTAEVSASFTPALYAKINATTGFESLGLAGAGATTIDASQLTSIKAFSLESDQVHFIDNMGTGGKVILDLPGGAGTNHTRDITLYCALNVDDLVFTIGSERSGGINLGGNVLIAHRQVAMVSNGTGASANSISNLQNSDESVYTITGSNALTIAATQARSIGSKYDGSAATGVLTINANTAPFSSGSARGDTIIGGSAADTLKAGLNSTMLTGGKGNDKFDVSIAKAGAAAGPNTTTVTDFTKGDVLVFAAKGSEAFTAAKVDVAGAATLAAAFDMAAQGDGSANGIVKWFQFGGNTYVVEDMSNGNFAVADIVVKLTGLLDLSTSTYSAAAHTLTFG